MKTDRDKAIDLLILDGENTKAAALLIVGEGRSASQIIEQTEITECGVTFNKITHTEPYYIVLYLVGDLEIKVISTGEESPNIPDSKTESLLTGFGSDNWAELNEEIDARGLIRPLEILE